MPSKAFVFGDNIDTDIIVPGKYLTLSKPDDLGKVCMSGVAENFAKNISDGDVFVAGKNFGCGSSREHAPISIKAAGIKCIIAISFARIFYRNAINIGLPILESITAAKSIRENDEILFELEKGSIKNITQNQSYNFISFPDFMIEIIRVGGLTNYIRKKKKIKGGS
jgi:3-isopropylmalate/(R)-2-methylmalate dehydratase small subunit